jgi:hypothetical protein
MFCSRRAAGVPQKLAEDVAYNGPFGDSTVLPSSQHGAKVGLTEREAPFGGSPMPPTKASPHPNRLRQLAELFARHARFG